MIKSVNLDNLNVDFILTLPEVIKAKEQIDSKFEGSVYFNIPLTSSLREILNKQFELDFSQIETIPMRWIKGDTKPHIDRGSKTFDKTYLAYLTDSPGELIIDSESYPITKGIGYVFSEGLLHETNQTGLEPRLLLGPMSEQCISVGGFSITADGETDIVYVRYNNNTSVNEYKINNNLWNYLSLPAAISNSNPDPANNILKIIFTTDITLFNSYDYFFCSSEGIQFGSTSLNSDGTRPIIKIDTTTDYNGLINNSFNSGSGYNNIYVFNLEVRAINGAALDSDGGWIGQPNFGKGASNNYIVNCSSNGPIIDAGGGIIGAYSGSDSGASLYIIGCSSSGNSGVYSGGIIGMYAGQNGGEVICESCWSTGVIGPLAGGIFGYYAGNNAGIVKAIKCYSTGIISGDYSGGIYGQFAGNAGIAEATNCYSQGNITTDAGGIFGGGAGSDGGTTPAINCYSSGTITTLGTGIYGSNPQDDSPQNCYVANGNWSDSNNLQGKPNPVVGISWVSTGINTPYELNNIGYTPYTLENIVFQGVGGTPILNQTYNQTISNGESSIPAIRSGYSYNKMNISGGDPSSYGSITINNNTGVISTSSSTASGTYTITIRNTGSYNITSFTLSIIQNIIPNVPICFPAGTPVLTDQGEIAIEKIDTKVNTIRGKEIVAITESIPLDSYLICIERNSLGPNIPNRRVITTKDHKIMCDNKLVRAEFLIRYIPTIYKVIYNKEKLYNVLLKEHSTMSINNLIVETMNPNHILAKIYSQNLRPEQKNMLIQMLNKYHIQERKKVVVRNNIIRP